MPSEVYRNVYVTPLIENSKYRNVLGLDEILKGVDLYTGTQTPYLQGLKVQADKIYEYAEDVYDFGLPAGTLYNGTTVSTSTVEDILDVEDGEATTVSLITIGVPNEDFFAKKVMTDNYGYNSATNIVSNPPFIPAGGSTVTYYDADFNAGNIEITYLVQPANTYTTVSEVVTGINLNNSYYMVNYTKASTGTNTQYWYYDALSGVYPELDLESTPLDATQFYPVIVLRSEKHTFTEAADGTKYTEGKEALSLLGIDFDTVMDAIHENPDIGSIEDTTIQFMVNLETKDPTELDYLWQYFKDLGSVNLGNLFGKSGNPQPSRVQLLVSSPAFYYASTAAILEETIYPGTIIERSEIVKNTTYITRPDGLYNGITFSGMDILYLRKQLTSTTYSEIVVAEFGMSYFAGPDYVSHGRNRAVGGGLHDIGTEFYRPMHIPINKQTLHRFTNDPVKRNNLLKYTLSMFIATRDVEDYEWYETKFFGELILAIAIVVSVVTLQPSLVTIASAASLYAAAELTFLLIAEYYLLGLAVDFTLDFLVKELGLEETFWIIAVAVITSAVTKGTNATSLTALPWAEDLMKTSMLFLNSLGNPIQDELLDIQTDAEDFLKSAEERQEELEAAESLLDTATIDPLTIIRPPVMRGFEETPEQFYNRTIHTPNPGVMSLDVIRNYVDNSIRLPTISDINQITS